MNSDFKNQKIKHFLQMNSIFCEIVNDANLDKKKIEMLQSHFLSMKLLLEDLGVDFSTENKVRELSLKISKLESQFENKNLNYENVSLFISSTKEKISSRLQEYGIKANIILSFNPDISLTINFYGVTDEMYKSSKLQYSEEEYIKKSSEIKINFKKFKSEFDTINLFSGKELNLSINEENIEKIKNIVRSLFDIDMTNFNYSIETRYFKDDEGKKALAPYLKSMSFSFLTLPSHIEFSKIFKR